MRNVMLKKHYAVLVDDIASKVYEHKLSGTLNIAIGEPVCKDLAVKSLQDITFGNSYVGCYDKNDEEHIIEFIKYVDINELLG